MDGRIDNGGLTATRFAQKPLHQPKYSFMHVPKPARNLSGSSLQRITNREPFLTSMAELLLLCKEAMRRRRSTTAATAGPAAAACSKPLSLEYLADRLDIDDPLFGYLIRTKENLNRRQNGPHWQKGMLQGFITVTTFTNWQRTFRWDSSNEAAFEFDEASMRRARLSGERKWDEDNQLATEMNQTVRFGDIWAEGVVWPRIAEISLLGGLGCGRAMISLVVEELERMKASGRANYDYVVLQATDNSIPFYETMGFVRVGAVMEDEVQLQKKKAAENGDDDSSSSTSSASDVVAEPVDEGSPEKPDVMALSDHVAHSSITTYRVPKAGTTLNDVAKRLRVDVWDIVFLNMKIYPELTPSSRLLEGTMLHVPKKQPTSLHTRSAVTPQYYTAKENDTPRMIAKMFKVSCLELVQANKVRHEGLVSSSRLKEGTRIKVSHLDQPDIILKPYSHWSFPDDQFEEGEPSYMMALKLNRRRGAAGRAQRPFASSLAVPISDYEPTTLLLPPSPPPVPLAPPPPAAAAAEAPSTGKKSKRRESLHPDAPKRPKKPLGPFMMYVSEQREVQRDMVEGMKIGQVSKVFARQWKDMSDAAKAKYHKRAEKALAEYQKVKAAYEKELEAFLAENPDSDEEDDDDILSRDWTEEDSKPDALPQQEQNDVDIKNELYNKVVKLKPEACTEGSEYKYWYVLTYIPDLKWCHLAPLEKVGTFGPEKPRAAGRPKWMLVDESLGKEVDISSRFCIPIKARFMKRTLDADKEEWDVIDDGTDPTERRQSLSRSDYDSDRNQNMVRKNRPGSLIKPSVTRKRQKTSGTLPLLFASYPGSSDIVTVKLQGDRLYDPSFDNPVKRGRGRPRGSKNKPKPDSNRKESLARLEGTKESESTAAASKQKGRSKGPTSREAAAAIVPDPGSPPKKRRGRPPGTGKKKQEEPSSPSLPEPETPKRRGRPPGSGKKKNPPLPEQEAETSRRRGRSTVAGNKQESLVSREDQGTPKRKGRVSVAAAAAKQDSSLSRQDAGTTKRRGQPSGSGRSKELDETTSNLTMVTRKRGRTWGSGKSDREDTIPDTDARPRRSAAPSYLGEESGSTSQAPSSSDESTEPSRKRRKISDQGERASSRPRRSAAPSFLGEAPDPVLSDESDKIPYQPRKSAVLESPRPTNKRWHPVRETRNGKNTPRARPRQEDVTADSSSVAVAPRRAAASERKPQNDESSPARSGDNCRRSKRKAAPTFTLDDTPRKRRSLHL